MPTLREIRRRIRSVKNTAQITRAMEMVAATKMRRAQVQALASRPYADKIGEVIADLSQATGREELHPLLKSREVRRVGLLLITADRGLCGALNSNVIEHAAHFIAERGVPVRVVAVGRKGRDWMLRHGMSLIAEFTGLGDRPSYLDTVPIARILMDTFVSGEVDEVEIIYPFFVNTMIQRPATRRLLPVGRPEERAWGRLDYIYEPQPAVVLAALLPRYIEVQVYHAILEAVASEHSARMVAMRNATENAQELVQELTLTYNKARQESITKELLDIASGAAALKKIS